jgi:hypothetical protein
MFAAMIIMVTSQASCYRKDPRSARRRIEQRARFSPVTGAQAPSFVHFESFFKKFVSSLKFIFFRTRSQTFHQAI